MGFLSASRNETGHVRIPALFQRFGAFTGLIWVSFLSLSILDI
jgi:hypothetical protein